MCIPHVLLLIWNFLTNVDVIVLLDGVVNEFIMDEDGIMNECSNYYDKNLVTIILTYYGKRLQS